MGNLGSTFLDPANIRGFEDLMVAEILEDSDTAFVIGELVRLPGAKALNLTPNYESVFQECRNRQVNRSTKTVSINADLSYCTLSAKAQKIIFGGKVIHRNPGETNEQIEWVYESGDEPPFFYLLGRVDSVNDANAPNADYLYELLKCKIDSGDFGSADQNVFAEPSITIVGEYTTYLINQDDDESRLYRLTKRRTGASLAPGALVAPCVASTVPAPNATGVVVSDDLVITYDGVIEFNFEDYKLFKKTNDFTLVEKVLTAPEVVYAPGPFTVTINPLTDLDAASDYVLLINGVQTDTPGQTDPFSDTLVIEFATA